MKFGERLREQREAAWASFYPDYDGLKDILTEMARTGQNKVYKGREGLVPHSIGSTEERINAAGPSEAEFMRKLDAEISKVSKHYTSTGDKLRARVKECEAHYARVAAAAPNGVVSTPDALEITNEVEQCESTLLKLDDFVNLSYSAFIKILKKHDKNSSCPMLMTYCVKLQGEAFLERKLTSVIMSLSNVNAKLMGKEAKTEAQFDPNQAGGTSFVRRTTKYWVRMSDLTRVKCIILKQLPVYKFTVGDADSDRVTSIYFDNDNLDLYTGRLHKTPGAIAVRMRWYGEDPMPGDPVWVERKVHNEAWYGDESRKERFSLPDELIQPYLAGKLTPSGVREILLKDKTFKGDLDAAVELAAEVQGHVLNKKLKPYMRTQYMRTAFQKKGDATVRSSLDTELCMALEPVGPGEYRYKGELVRDQICQFPHGVLEVKLQLAGNQTTPDWVADLLDSGLLIEVNKFGKFVHGLAALLPASRVKELPYWFNQVNLEEQDAEAEGAKLKNSKSHKADRTQQERIVYKEPETSSLQYLAKLFLQWSKPKPFQKVVTGKLVVEPKVYFANERTFLVWGSLCTQLGSISVGILAISFHRPQVMRVGVILMALTFVFFLYALIVFQRRAHGLRVRSTEAPYDDRFGPTMVRL
mmetsp:Transcript_49922/g.114443  ORF Transcript_49922/g.114443 Transcript_49922/m.114443 type:complete len:642 (-) Transcript_49922:22-1947(-)